jgi:hypothetical protein
MWDNHRLQNNLITQAQLMLEYNDDLSMQEAENIVNNNKSVNQELQNENRR